MLEGLIDDNIHTPAGFGGSFVGSSQASEEAKGLYAQYDDGQREKEDRQI